jgi:hypothetical protein
MTKRLKTSRLLHPSHHFGCLSFAGLHIGRDARTNTGPAAYCILTISVSLSVSVTPMHFFDLDAICKIIIPYTAPILNIPGEMAERSKASD